MLLKLFAKNRVHEHRQHLFRGLFEGSSSIHFKGNLHIINASLFKCVYLLPELYTKVCSAI